MQRAVEAPDLLSTAGEFEGEGGQDGMRKGEDEKGGVSGPVPAIFPLDHDDF